MAGITVSQAQADLDEARASLSAIRQAQRTQLSSATGGRSIDRAQMDAAIRDVAACEQRLARLSRNGGQLSSWSVVPL